MSLGTDGLDRSGWQAEKELDYFFLVLQVLVSKREISFKLSLVCSPIENIF